MAAPNRPRSRLLRDPHTVEADDVCRHFEVDPNVGLSSAALEVHRALFGTNELAHEEPKSILSLLLEQFQDLLARILLMAALVSFLLALVSGEADEGLAAFVEPMVIVLILVANAAVSVWQESKAEKSLDALKKLQPELARVLREGKWLSVPAQELVPGDIVEVHVGDKVPADLRMLQLQTISLRAEQSQLTGEAATVPKETNAMDVSWQNCEIQSKINMLFASTTIANGSARAIVIATGMTTEIGKVQAAVQTAGAEEEQTPLQEKLDEFGELLSKVIGIICILVWLINFGNFSEPSHGGFLRGCIYYFKTAVALAVAAIPEGLTAVITTCLALGTRKMAQKNAIVRRLPSVETLGCTTVICSDKTGTLTTNEMSCTRFTIPNSRGELDSYVVEGTTYSPVGRVWLETENGLELFNSVDATHKGLHHFLRCASLCNAARLELNPVARDRFARQGEPTEAALKVLVEKMGCPDTHITRQNHQTCNRAVAEAFGNYWTFQWDKLAVLEFSRDRKSMSVLCRERNASRSIQYVKGAPESILERSTGVMLPNGSVIALTATLKQRILEITEAMAGDALRTLALCVKLDTETLSDYSGPDHPEYRKLMEPENFVLYEQGLIFCGLVGMVDPARPEVPRAIKLCRAAGIKVMMITGDNKKTAETIAVKVGIVPGGDLKRLSYTGREFEMLPEAEKIRVLSSPKGAVFSRTEPKHKQMIIRILKELGEITAMTGDGVNDAPALKQADIGIAMGITGTEVAKEASDMVLADDNFSSIVLAVEEGRSIYNNMKAFIRYLISSNIGEVASIFLTAALGIPEGLAPVQLLWVNLVTDGFPATALGFNPPDVDVMKKAPRRRDDPLISAWVFLRYLIIGLYVGIATVGIFIWWYVYGVDPADGHSLVTFHELSHWSQCHNWGGFMANTVYGMDPSDPCSYFKQGKVKASTLSLTVLVVIEMFNAFNALSEDGSLFQLPPWSNPWLLLATAGSIAVHCLILYVAPLASIFGVVPLSLHDWTWVVMWSFPVLLIDELLKAYARMRERKAALPRRPGRPKKTQ